MVDEDAPSRRVLSAFGAAGPAVRLAGGRGLTFRAGSVVLRPAEELAEAVWKCDVLEHLETTDAFTVPRPIRTVDGDWVRDGWQALEWIPGAADETRVADVVRAGLAFQEAIAELPAPAFLSAAVDRWSLADRIAWGSEPLPDDGVLDPIAAELRRVTTPGQVIHGDLLGNVLFAPGRPPAIIDWAPYWRPTGYAAAIAVVDAACWHGLPLGDVAVDHGIPDWRQLLLRALAFRVVTQQLGGRWDDELIARHEPVAEAILALPE